MRRFAFSFAAFLAFVSPALAQGDDATVAKNDIPKAVADAVACGTEPEFITREAYAGGWLWKWQCASNHANYIQAHVFSRGKDGSGARALRFPTPYRGKQAWLEELSNSEFFPLAREFNHLFVDPEDKRVCRTEARWVAGRDPLKPQLVFWRETKDCDGKSGWRVRVDKKQ
jgi:hypothetical protein